MNLRRQRALAAEQHRRDPPAGVIGSNPLPFCRDTPPAHPMTFENAKFSHIGRRPPGPPPTSTAFASDHVRPAGAQPRPSEAAGRRDCRWL